MVIDNSASDEVGRDLRALLSREVPFVKMIGESQAPQLAAVCNALEVLGKPDHASELMGSWLVSLCRASQSDAAGAVADPYHPLDELLRRSVGGEVDEPDEKFDGHAYTAHLAVDWLARRGRRAPVSAAWPDLTRLTLCEFEVSEPSRYLTDVDDDGTLRMWQVSLPGSWKELTEAARSHVDAERLPKTLRSVAHYLPFLPIIFPPRFDTHITRAIDENIGDARAGYRPTPV